MLNRETFQTDPADYRLANQGVAKISFPPITRGVRNSSRGAFDIRLRWCLC